MSTLRQLIINVFFIKNIKYYPIVIFKKTLYFRELSTYKERTFVYKKLWEKVWLHYGDGECYKR